MSFIVNPYAFAVGGFGPDPSTISNLELWLKADAITGVSEGGDVNIWVDSSGNSRDATGAVGTGSIKPTYLGSGGPNSQPAVRMSATGASGTASRPRFNLPNFMTGFSAGHGFTVVKLDSDPPPTDGESSPVWGDWGSGGDGYFCFGGDSKIYDDFGTNSRKTTVNPTPALTSWRLYEVRSASAAWSNHLDGTQLFSTGTNTVGWSTSPYIGFTATNSKRLNGIIAEVIFYSRVLNSTEISKIKSYITAKYGLTLA